MGDTAGPAPIARDNGAAHGHWLLARLGKRVLRPGGVELTRRLLDRASLAGADVVEFAPGLGRTAAEIIARTPHSYRAVEQDAAAARTVNEVVGSRGTVTVADAADSGLLDSSADVVVGEAMLTMQGDSAKRTIISEAARLLRPGGRYAIHELGLVPDDLPSDVKTDIRRSLAKSLKVNARPLTIPEWAHLLAECGLAVDGVATAPMALLQPRRIIADEGVTGAVRIARNLVRQPDARGRVLAMRSTLRAQREHLTAIAVIAHKPERTTS